MISTSFANTTLRRHTNLATSNINVIKKEGVSDELFHSGSAYSPPPFQAGTDSAEICVEQALPNGLDPNIMIVSVVDAKDGTDRLFVNYKVSMLHRYKKNVFTFLFFSAETFRF